MAAIEIEKGLNNHLMNRRWLVTGGSGQLALEFERALQLRQQEYVLLSKQDLDISNREDTVQRIAKELPTHVINCAAYTNVDGAESNKELAFEINAAGAENVAIASSAIGAHLTHFSTDYVFDGSGTSPYSTRAPKHPTSIYGESKSKGEELVQAAMPDSSLILRTSWLYSQFGANFVKKMIELEKVKETLSVVNDQIGQPTWCSDVAGFTIENLLQTNITGLHHLTNAGSTSWFHFAQKIFELIGKDKDRILAVPSSQFPQKAKRPNYSVLDHSDWEELSIEPLRDWEYAITEAISNEDFL